MVKKDNSMYNRTQRRSQKKHAKKTSFVGVLLMTVLSFFAVKWFGHGLTTNVAVADTQQTETILKQEIKPTKTEVLATPLVAQPAVTEPQAPAPSEPAEEVPAETTTEAVVTEEPVVYSETTGYPVVLANGNTAGPIGTEAAARMAAATGVPQETWEYIIARESNGDPNVANPSGASGLFQTMPGWGSTETVEDQINAAINAYNHQGLSAWSVD